MTQRRPRLLGVLGAYGAVSMSVMSFTETVFPTIQLPNWSVGLVIFICLIGWPIVVIMTWGLAPPISSGSTKPASKVGVAPLPEPAVSPQQRDLTETQRVSVLVGSIQWDRFLLSSILSIALIIGAIYYYNTFIFQPRAHFGRAITQRYLGISVNREFKIPLPTTFDVLAVDPKSGIMNASISWVDLMVTKAEMVGEVEGDQFHLNGVANSSRGSWDVTMDGQVNLADSSLVGSYVLLPRRGNKLGVQRGDIDLEMCRPLNPTCGKATQTF